MRWRLLIAVLIVGLGLTFVGVRAQQTVEVSGVVLDEDSEPVEGATVRIQATTNATTTGPDGTFTLYATQGIPVTVIAWKRLYYCAKVEGVAPPASGITLVLGLYQTNDNPDYEWELPTSEDPEHVSCAHCKPGVTDIWLENAHAGAGTNPRFFSMYNGTDTTGQPNVGPGYKLDFPNTAGNCATCHAPGAAANEPFTADMNEPNRLWRNDSPTGRHWLGLRLQGRLSNTSAIGARVVVTTVEGSYVQEVSGGAGRGSQNSLPLEFGLGPATVVEELTIRWPNGIVQTRRNVAVDQYLTFTEPVGTVRRSGGRRIP